MGDLSERERGLFRDWAVRKPWTPGDKRPSDQTLPPGEADAAEDPVLDAFNALAATEIPEGEQEGVQPAVETRKAEQPGEPAPEASMDEEAATPEDAPAAAAAEIAPVAVAAASMPEGSWNPEPVRAGTRRASAQEAGLSHVNERGEARMVDVTEKDDTDREAIAEGYVTMQASTLKLVMGGGLAKGDVLAAARIAGIMAAKRTSELIPMCHPLPLTGVTVDLAASGEGRLHIVATVHTTGKTGVEMEALTAVTVAGLTVYDMAKAVDRGMRIESVRLLEKRGGKSGEWRA